MFAEREGVPRRAILGRRRGGTVTETENKKVRDRRGEGGGIFLFTLDGSGCFLPKKLRPERRTPGKKNGAVEELIFRARLDCGGLKYEKCSFAADSHTDGIR